MGDVDRYLTLERRFVDGYRRGTASRWLSCLAASRIVGDHAPGQTKRLAQTLAVDVSAVEDMARAGLTYRALRPGRPELVGVRQSLTYSHFAAAGELMRAYDISPHEMIEQLRMAAEQGASVRAFKSLIAGEHGPAPEGWLAVLDRMRRLALNLQVRGDLPAGLVKIVDRFIKDVEVYRVENGS
jgi:hypothetical protein